MASYFRELISFLNHPSSLNFSLNFSLNSSLNPSFLPILFYLCHLLQPLIDHDQNLNYGAMASFLFQVHLVAQILAVTSSNPLLLLRNSIISFFISSGISILCIRRILCATVLSASIILLICSLKRICFFGAGGGTKERGGGDVSHRYLTYSLICWS